MDLLTIDFETYWDSDYTLSKMTTDSYVLDPRFKVHGAAVRLRSMHEKSVYLTDVFLATFLAGIDWSKTALLAHNTAFDGFIITHHYGHKPAFYLDTLSMARAVLGATVGGSLAAVAAHYQLGEKGHTVLDTKGIRDLSPELHKELAAYAVNDLELCLRAFAKMKPEFSMEELELIDMTIRMFTEPMVRLDKDMLKEEIESERARKQKLIDEVCNGDPSILVSNKQFADLLFMYGVEAPTKISQTTGKETFALAKTDPGFRELLEHEDEAIRTLAEARLDLKSSIAQTRAERLYEVAAADRPWPVMLNYYGAHVTGRWSGGNKQNAQNLPSGRDGKTPVLRNSIMAPPGYEIVVADSSQIEARTLAWLAGQNDLVDTFRNKGDPYCRMASALYKREIHKDTDPNERQVGKTMVLGCGYGMGPDKFRGALKNSTGITITPQEATLAVATYRAANKEIVKFWRQCEEDLHRMAHRQSKLRGCYEVGPHGILLPNGMRIKYPGLLQGSEGFTYSTKNGRTKIYGGKVTENLIQALARIIVAGQMLVIEKALRKIGGRVWLMAHDEVCALVPKEKAAVGLQLMLKVMHVPPKWAPDLPLAAEGGRSDRYGAAKR